MSSVVFLQGPLGPFFAKLAQRLSRNGVKTHRICFNGGDRHFAWADHSVDYRGPGSDWAAFLRAYLQDNQIRSVFVYGDCRFYHREARAVCEALGVSFGVFEEGYLRPDFVTFEWGGVNALSCTDWSRQAIDSYQPRGRRPSIRVGLTFWQRAWFAIQYYLAARVVRKDFPHYRHHRNRSWKAEAGCWLRSMGRKWLYKVTQRGLLPRLSGALSGRFYLMPLQTRDDFQVRTHSDLLTVENSIDRVITSFARHADAGDRLVIKHHPMDRGFCHYAELIDALAHRHGLGERVIYCHDLHLPTLLEHAKGVVTINSTVGISALLHRAPTKVLGRGLYDMQGLTHQGDLASFWTRAEPVDSRLFRRFHTYLYELTQLDGSFFKHIDKTVDGTWGYLVPARPARRKRATEVAAATAKAALPVS